MSCKISKYRVLESSHFDRYLRDIGPDLTAKVDTVPTSEVEKQDPRVLASQEFREDWISRRRLSCELSLRE